MWALLPLPGPALLFADCKYLVSADLLIVPARAGLAGLCWAVLGWAGVGWSGLGWAGVGWRACHQ